MICKIFYTNEINHVQQDEADRGIDASILNHARKSPKFFTLFLKHSKISSSFSKYKTLIKKEFNRILLKDIQALILYYTFSLVYHLQFYVNLLTFQLMKCVFYRSF